MLLLYAFALAMTDTPNDTCKQLAKEFETNEWSFAFSHDLKAGILEIEEEADRSMAAADHNLAMAEARARAVGVYVRPRSDSSERAEKITRSRQKLEESDREFKEEGDRITTLLIANKCSPPDHVTGWYTYSSKNPNRKVLAPASAGK